MDQCHIHSCCFIVFQNQAGRTRFFSRFTFETSEPSGVAKALDTLNNAIASTIVFGIMFRVPCKLVCLPALHSGLQPLVNVHLPGTLGEYATGAYCYYIECMVARTLLRVFFRSHADADIVF